MGASLAICAHVCTLCQHKGRSLRRIRHVRVYGWLIVGQSSSSVVMGIALVSAVDIGFPDQISGGPRGCRPASISVAMLRAMMEGQSDLPPM